MDFGKVIVVLSDFVGMTAKLGGSHITKYVTDLQIITHIVQVTVNRWSRSRFYIGLSAVEL